MASRELLPSYLLAQDTSISYALSNIADKFFSELSEISKHRKQELDTLWDEIKRLNNPHKYIVDLSSDLWYLKTNMLKSK